VSTSSCRHTRGETDETGRATREEGGGGHNTTTRAPTMHASQSVARQDRMYLDRGDHTSLAVLFSVDLLCLGAADRRNLGSLGLLAQG
jgi:hypothetical protein